METTAFCANKFKNTMYKHTHTHTHRHTHTHTMYICTCMPIYICMYTCASYLYTHMYTYVSIYVSCSAYFKAVRGQIAPQNSQIPPKMLRYVINYTTLNRKFTLLIC